MTEEYRPIISSVSSSYIVVWKKGYQEFQEPHGTSVIKVKGIARVSGNNATFFTSNVRQLTTKSLTRRPLDGPMNSIWDAPEYEVPPIVSFQDEFFAIELEFAIGKQCLLHCHTTNSDLRTKSRRLSDGNCSILRVSNHRFFLE